MPPFVWRLASLVIAAPVALVMQAIYFAFTGQNPDRPLRLVTYAIGYLMAEGAQRILRVMFSGDESRG